MRKWALQVVEIINGCLIFSGIYCTLARQIYENESEIFWSSLVLIPIMILMSFGAHRARHFWQYAFCAIISLGFAYPCSAVLLQKILMLIFTLFIICSYFAARVKHTSCWLQEPKYICLLLFLLMYLLAGRTDSDFLRFYACYGTGIYYLLVSYHINVVEMDDFVRMHAKLDRFPERRLVKSSRRMMWIQSGFVAVAMFLAPFIGIDRAITEIGRFLRNLLVWIVSLLARDGDDQTEQAVLQETVQKSDMMLPISETSRWMEILSKILEMLMLVLVASIILFVLYKIGKRLYEMYLQFGERMEENGDKVERIAAISTEEKARAHVRRKENLFWDRSANARIRKFYKKRIHKGLKARINPAWTPQEIEQCVDIPEKDKEILHMYYEKARYGSESCTTEELQEVLNIR